MELYDREKAARVWQRVLSDVPPAPEASLQPLILWEQENAGAYLALAGRLPQKAGGRLRQFAIQSRANADCLKGICILQELPVPAVKVLEQRQHSLSASLRLCFRREMQCYAGYEERSSDPEFGAVFAQLAAGKGSQCRQLLELLGKEAP